MSYTPHTWQSGETVTAEKLNVLEQGVASGGGGIMILTVSQQEMSGDSVIVLSKTYAEIKASMEANAPAFIIWPYSSEYLVGNEYQVSPVTGIGIDNASTPPQYMIVFDQIGTFFVCAAENDYPYRYIG